MHYRNIIIEGDGIINSSYQRNEVNPTRVKTRIQILFFIKDFYFYRLFVTTKSARASCLFFPPARYTVVIQF